jgi:hypothetical protein
MWRYRVDIIYEISFDENRTEVFKIELDNTYLQMKPFPIEGDDHWLKLEFHQCGICPFTKKDFEFCPVARNLAFVVHRFSTDISHTQVHTKVITNERTIVKNASLQEGLYPLMGLIMASSGCPILDVFKPMVFTHLPFANYDETLLRVVSVYLIGQYIRKLNGLSPDWDLNEFKDMYTRVEEVNLAFVQRFREFPCEDANINALLLLNLFTHLGDTVQSGEWIEKLIPFYSEYLK